MNPRHDRRMTGNRLIPCLVFVIALAAGTLAASEMTCPFFYQPMMQDMVMWSCGHGLATPASDIPELTDFLACRQETFPCAAIPDTIETRPAGVFVRMHLYLTMAIGLFWRAFGVSYASLFPLFGLMHGLYVLAVYLLARQFFNRWAAAGVSLILAFSPVALGMLFFLRDYSKAPFIIGALALLLFTLRRPTLRGAALAAAAAGAVVGVGIGFRSDCLLLLPIGCGVLAIGLVSARGWRGTAACVLSFAAVALLAGAPIFSASQGGMFGCFAMQGATDPFQRFLDMGDTPYSLGWRYSDELTLSCVAVDMPSPEPGRDAEDGRAPGSPPLAGSQSVTYLSRWAHLFAADFATRALKSVAWIAGFETLARPGHLLSDPGGPSRSITRTGTLLDPVLRPLGASWMPWLGCAGLLALLLRVYARSPARIPGPGLRHRVPCRLPLVPVQRAPPVPFAGSPVAGPVRPGRLGVRMEDPARGGPEIRAVGGAVPGPGRRRVRLPDGGPGPGHEVRDRGPAVRPPGTRSL